MRLCGLVLTGLLGACASLPAPYSLTCGEADAPHIAIAPDGRTATTRLDVLTYNIEGLPWPARSGRARKLREIGQRLEALQRAGSAPDIVLFQEAFSSAATKAIVAAGFPAITSGPTRVQRRGMSAAGRVPGARRWRKGELGIHLLSSGLVVASRYPIVASGSEPFSRRSCAGFDCLSNKGALFARIAVPGVPAPIDIFNTHMNAQGASGVARTRHTPAHNLQAQELGDFLDAHRDRQYPALLGGDFNMRRSEPRFDVFNALQPLTLVHQYCMIAANACDVRMSWDGDAPWMDTQDLQLFASGAQVSIRPERVEAMFDGSPESPMLSDHDAFRVVYTLSWIHDATAMTPSPPACLAL